LAEQKIPFDSPDYDYDDDDYTENDNNDTDDDNNEKNKKNNFISIGFDKNINSNSIKSKSVESNKCNSKSESVRDEQEESINKIL